MKTMKRILAALLMVCVMMSFMSFGICAEGEDKTSDVQVVHNGEKQYYLASGEPADTNHYDVWTSKTIAGTEKEDEFEVTLQVGTTMKAIPNDVAVVLVMDVSGSMMNDETGERWYDDNMPEDRKRRIEYTREAAMAFAKAYVENAGGAERMLSVVQFGNQAQTVLPWTDVNNGGKLDNAAKTAIENVRVNFSVKENVSYWDESIAMSKWGKVDYWDGSEVTAEMKDETKDYFTSKCQAAELNDYFQSYLKTETVQQEIEGAMVDVEVTSCTYPECLLTTEHKHCSYGGCTQPEDHKHCAVAECAVAEAHIHCSVCALTEEHTHCEYENCEVAEAHTHCGRENCAIIEAHKHCVRCGETSEHTHIVGCTLGGCTAPYNGPHTHCCTHSRDCILPYTMKYRWSVDYNYRCKNPDSTHTHDFWDSDTAYPCFSRYFGSVWAIGTNMEAGLLLARNLVTTGQKDGGAIDDINNVYVILLSDGKPTWRTDETSTTETKAVGQADNTGTWDALKDIVKDGSENDIAIAEDIKSVAELYAILYGSELESKFSVGTGHPLTGVSCADWITKSGDYYVGADAVFNSPNSDGIQAAFLQINDRVDILAKAWTVSDALSDDVTFVEFSENGQYAGYAPADGSKTAAVSWSLGGMEPESGSGKVDDPYIYTLKYTIKLNSGKDNVKEASLLTVTDENSDVPPVGVWTGEETQLQYFMIEKDALDKMTPEEIKAEIRTAKFTDVKVRGLYGNLSFVKKNGETGEVIPGVGFTLYDSNNQAYGSEILSDNEGKIVFSNVPCGEYTLRETSVPEGMQEMKALDLQEAWGVMRVSDGSTVSAEILNWPVGMEVPKTGDLNANALPLWIVLSTLSCAGLAGVFILGRKKSEVVE